MVRICYIILSSEYNNHMVEDNILKENTSNDDLLISLDDIYDIVFTSEGKNTLFCKI